MLCSARPFNPTAVSQLGLASKQFPFSLSFPERWRVISSPPPLPPLQVTSYSLSLHEIDTVRGAKGMITSAIEIMVRKGHIKILSDPLVKTLITTKWQRFASTQFALHGLLYLIFVVAQTLLVWLHCSASQWNQTSRQVGALRGTGLSAPLSFHTVHLHDPRLDLHLALLTIDP